MEELLTRLVTVSVELADINGKLYSTDLKGLLNKTIKELEKASRCIREAI